MHSGWMDGLTDGKVADRDLFNLFVLFRAGDSAQACPTSTAAVRRGKLD